MDYRPETRIFNHTLTLFVFFFAFIQVVLDFFFVFVRHLLTNFCSFCFVSFVMLYVTEMKGTTLVLNCIIQILFLVGKDGESHCLYLCSECIYVTQHTLHFTSSSCAAMLQAALQYRALWNRTLLAVPQHLEQIEKYAHCGTLSDDAYRKPWVRGGCLPL